MRNKIKTISTFIVTVVASILLGMTIVNAEEIAKTLTIKSTNYKDTPLTFPETFHVKKTSGGKYVYCITYAKKTPSSGIKYTKDTLVTDNGKNYILREAYKNVDSNKDFFIYQTALWIYMQDEGLMNKSNSIATFRKKVYNTDYATSKKIRNIVAAAKKASKNDTSAPTIKLDTSNVNFTLDSEGKYYVSSKIKVTSSTSKYSVSFTDAPKSTKYEIKNGYLYVSVLASEISNLKTTFKVNVSNSKTVYISYNYKPTNSSYQKMAATYKQVKNAKDSLSLTLTKTVDIPINKVDADSGKAVKGAELQVKNSSGKVVDSWITDGNSHILTGLSQGTYTLTETKAPDGYNISNVSVKFTIDSKGVVKNSNGTAITNIVYKNTKALSVVKIDSVTGKSVSGAKLEIKDADGKVVDSWTTNSEAHTVKSLTKGTYTLSEVEAPNGYILSNEKITFTVDNDGNAKDSNGNTISKLEIKNTENSVAISKQDVTNNKELPGATLVLKDSKGNKIDTWVSTDNVHIIKGLTAGEYSLTEIVAPDGYVISKETVNFKVDKYGKITDKNGATIDKVIMYNTPKKQINITISKQDITTSKELPGASLTITDSQNNIIDTWVSSNEVHVVKDIQAGTYTLTETQAPNGYILSKEEIKFTVDKDGRLTDEDGKSIDKVIMYNKPKEEKHVTISKQDITTSKELPGASLVLKDADGSIIDSWVSSNKAHEINDIKAGTYTLTETQAPNGYVLSEETIKFTIDNSGKITDEFGNEIDKVIMFNKPISKTEVEISKQDITTSKELPGASLVVKDKNGKVIDSWVSGSEPHKIKELTEGTYTLTETQAPNGYVLSTETITFKIDANGKLTDESDKGIDKVVMYNEKEKITPNVPIVKQDAKTHKNLAGATLEIKDKDGKVIDTWVSTVEAHNVELGEGTYTLTETQAPNGYVLNITPITFNVTSDGKITDINGKTINTVIMNNIPKEVVTKVSISKQDITNGKELPGAHLVVKDKNGNVVDSWTSTDKPHTITGLTPGEYTLNEVVAPNGYILSNETITFTVKPDGSVTSVVMYNKPEENIIPGQPIIPNQPSTPGQEIEVENTASFKNVASTLIGGFAVIFGSTTIAKKTKRKKFN